MFYLFLCDEGLKVSELEPSEVIFQSEKSSDIECLKSFIESNVALLDFMKFYSESKSDSDYEGDVYSIYIRKRGLVDYDLIILADGEDEEVNQKDNFFGYVRIMSSASKLLINDANIYLDSVLKFSIDDFLDLANVLNGDVECQELFSNVLKTRVKKAITYGLVYNKVTKEKCLTVIGCVISDNKISYFDLGEPWIILKKSTDLNDLIGSM